MLTNEQLAWVNEQLNKGMSKRMIAEKLGVQHKYLLYCLNKSNPLRKKIDNAIRIANQLRYPDSVKNAIKKATTEDEITRALKDGREQL